MTRDKVYSIPSTEAMMRDMKKLPLYMWPNLIPHAIVGEGMLSDELCDAMIAELDELEPYVFYSGAVTRELPRPLSNLMSPIIAFALEANKGRWNFELSISDPAAWYQTYTAGGNYPIHTDTALGTSRKLTTVVMLSDPADYEGGILRIIPWPDYQEIPRTRGTMITFPSWMLHEVSEIHSGTRRTLNLGHYGPPFR